MGKIAIRIMIGMGIFVIILPIVLNFIFCKYDLPSAYGLGNPEWLGFWAGYLGSVIGGFCTLITIILTIKYYERQDKVHQAELENNRIQHEKEMQEMIEMQYRPLLVLYPDGGSGSNNNFSQINLIINNVGIYAAVHCQFDDGYINVVNSNDKEMICIKSENGQYPSRVQFTVESVIGKKYFCNYELRESYDIDRDKEIRVVAKYYYALISMELQ